MASGVTRIQLCGELSVVWKGAPVDLPGRQGRLLFAYLVLSRPRSVRRDELVEALWPSGDGGGKPDALSPPLSRLRRVLGADAVSTGSELRLALPDDAEVDWEAVHDAHERSRAALRAGDHAAAWSAGREGAAIAERGLLPGLDAPWIDERRRDLADLRIDLLEAVATAGIRLGRDTDLAEAERVARDAVAAAPFRESAWHALIEALHARGNLAEALRQYEELRTLLREELGTRPSARLQALHERLLKEDDAPAPPPAVRAATPQAAPPRLGPTAPPAGRPLFERERELYEVDGQLGAAVAHDGRVVLIEGPAGIGKTALLTAARRHAADRNLPVATGRGSELEREFPFGVVRQLFEPLLADPAERERLLSGAAAPAAAVFGTGPELDPSAGDGSFAVLHGLYWLTLNASASAPLVLAVDDLQWCDLASLRFVAYLSHRLEGLPVLVVATVRTGEPPTDAALLADITHDPATVSVRPGPLSLEGVTGIVADRLGPDAAPEFCAAVADVTGGNPLLVGQLVAALASDGVAPTADSVPVVREVGPRAVSRSVLTRLGRLPDDAIAAARAIAVLGESAELPAVAALAELGEREAAGATGALVRAELLRPEPPLGFVHPLVREAVYRDLPHAEREFQHGRAARVLADLGAPADQISSHLLVIPRRGEAWIADTLHEAGLSARRRGAAESAVAYLRRALAEPPAADKRPRVLLDLGLAEGLTNGVEAVDHLREAYSTLTEPLDRARAAFEASRIMNFVTVPGETVAFARAGAAELEGASDPDLRDYRQRLMAIEQVAWFFGSRDDETLAKLIEQRHEPLDDSPGGRMRKVTTACYWTYAGAPVDECCALVLDALRGDVLFDHADQLFAIIGVNLLTTAGRDEAVEIFDRLVADAHRRGSSWGVLSTHMWRGWLRVLRGELADAEESLQRGVDGGRTWGIGDGMPWATAFHARYLIERGEYEGARATLGIGTPAQPSQGAQIWLCTRAELELIADRPEAAIASAEEARAMLPEQTNPAFVPALAIKARALAALGRRDEAIAAATEEVGYARAFGAPSVVGPSLRALGEVMGTDGIDALRESVTLLERSSAQLDLAKSRAALGEALLAVEEKNEARTLLAEALELAEKCSADALSERVRAQMRVAGARPRRTALSGPAALTTSEREVAQLAAEGGSNRDIAQQLYVTPKTVEVHLTNAYRKLGIRSRRELPEALTGAPA